MKKVVSNILDWIAAINDKSCNYNEFYQVPAITIRTELSSKCVQLSEIANEYIEFLVKDFQTGLDEEYSFSERICLPIITKVLPYIDGIEIDYDKVIWLNDLGEDSILRNMVLNKILEYLVPIVNNNQMIQRYGINVFCIEGIVFADVCYALNAIRNLNEFNIWVKAISNPCTMIPKFTIRELDKLEYKILFDGDINELYNIPRSVKMNMTEYLTGYCDDIVGEKEVEVTLSVKVTDDNFIVLLYPKSKLHEEYFDRIISECNRLHTNIQGYNVIPGDVYEIAQYLKDNKILCKSSGYEGCYISEIIEGKQAYEMADIEDSKTWDGCIGNVVMINVPQEELKKYHETLYWSQGFLMKFSKD